MMQNEDDYFPDGSISVCTEERSPDVPDNSHHQPPFGDAQLRNGGNHPNDRRFHERSSWIQGGPGT